MLADQKADFGHNIRKNQINISSPEKNLKIITEKNASTHTHKDVFPHFKHKNGAYRARTYDPLLVRQMLSQLS